MPTKKIKAEKVPQSSLKDEQQKLVNDMIATALEEMDKTPSRVTRKIVSTSPNLIIPRSFFQFEEVKPVLNIRNVVATYSIGIMPNLKKLAFLMGDTLPGKYDPDGFAAMRITIFIAGSVKTVALLFSNGNVVHTGGKSEWHTRYVAWYFCHYLRSIGLKEAQLCQFRIQNIVSSFQFGHPINCYEIVEKLGSIRASFKPSAIQCCFIKNPEKGRQVALVFLAGGCVLTGMKTREQILEAFEEVIDIGASVSHDFGGDSKSSYCHKKEREITSDKHVGVVNKNITLLSHSKNVERSSGRKRTAQEMEDIQKDQLFIDQAEANRKRAKRDETLLIAPKQEEEKMFYLELPMQIDYSPIATN